MARVSLVLFQSSVSRQIHGRSQGVCREFSHRNYSRQYEIIMILCFFSLNYKTRSSYEVIRSFSKFILRYFGLYVRVVHIPKRNSGYSPVQTWTLVE